MGLTQEQFAERLYVTPLTVLRWESGQSRPRRLALTRLRELEEEASAESASRHIPPAPQVRTAPPLDFAGDPDAVSAVAEAWRLAYGTSLIQLSPAKFPASTRCPISASRFTSICFPRSR